MGTDMDCAVHKLVNGQWQWVADSFDWRDYGLFGFLADVRNYSCVNPVAPRRGLPADILKAKDEAERNAAPFTYDYLNDILGVPVGNDHNFFHWLMLKELLDVDYEAVFEDRRGDNSETLPVGQGKMTSLRDFLGKCYFEELERLKGFGKPEEVRLVMWFG